MRTSTQKRIARFSGLLLVALLAFALAIPAAQAMRDVSTGTGGSSTSAGSGASQPRQVPTLALNQGVATSSAAQPVSTGTSSTTWIAVGVAVAALIIALAAWVLIRRRRQPGVPGSSAYCASHPEDSLCGAG
jgi:LPXTG-motif cell wall-anchored protein